MVVTAVARHLAEPAVGAFARAIADQGIIYQSEAFGTTLTARSAARLGVLTRSQRRAPAKASSLPAPRR
jgi:hypothetical protein